MSEIDEPVIELLDVKGFFCEGLKHIDVSEPIVKKSTTLLEHYQAEKAPTHLFNGA